MPNVAIYPPTSSANVEKDLKAMVKWSVEILMNV
jgi:hypothetical protein